MESQFGPVNPGGHVHVYDLTPSVHVAPFLHGLLAHSFDHEQTRLDVDVGAVVSTSSAPHTVRSAHERSEVAVGATVWYSVSGLHVLTFVHPRLLVSVGTVVSNWLLKQTDTGEHTRLLEAVGAVVWYDVPSTQAVTGEHGELPVVVNVLGPQSQLVPQNGDGHAHVYDDGPSVQVPPFWHGPGWHSSTSWHTRFEVSVGAAVCCCDAVHTVSAWHWKLLVAVAAAVWNCVAG